MQQVLAEIGIKATLRYEDVPTWLKRLYTDYNFQLSSTRICAIPATTGGGSSTCAGIWPPVAQERLRLLAERAGAAQTRVG